MMESEQKVDWCHLLSEWVFTPHLNFSGSTVVGIQRCISSVSLKIEGCVCVCSCALARLSFCLPSECRYL